ncbi:phosphatidate cytidylyltransferase [Bacillus sp. UMB0899]|uniref:phosphatidate cytidylyltransferase n=1 Tax=Metabacillus schmidteae TaxID=2730405 RepID=UPI000C8016B7|nr:phosphatidate cytidylyltransferase [Metabacillus schmidteae]PMC40257.1 phosphatidate cytidylyltransferase [Bacillus sp. UMB0899]
MKERILTGIIIALLFMIPFYIGDIWFTLFTLLLAGIAYYEFSTIIHLRLFGTKWFVGIIGIFLLFLPILSSINETLYIKIFIGLVLFFITSTVFNEHFSIEKAGTLLIGILYIGFGFISIAEARMEEGLLWTFTILLVIWSTDSGAYFVGRKFGKRKLAPKISPNKTVEGAIGGIIVSICIAFFIQAIAQPFESLLHTTIITLLVSTSGQIGDLVESALKRHFGVKDSGKILPGHGGILDRLDSWIFVFICLKLFGIV